MPAINGASIWRNKLGKKLLKIKKNQSQLKNFLFGALCYYVTLYFSFFSPVFSKLSST